MAGIAATVTVGVVALLAAVRPLPRYAWGVSPAKQHGFIPIDVYLAGELKSEVKHEYVGGRIYAMAGASTPHNRIAVNVLAGLHAQLRGRRCEVFNSDMKIRIRLPTHVRFYYPDVSVVCLPNPPTDSFQDEPVAIFEVVSSDTRRADEGEKKDHYLTIPSLSVYVLLEQDSMVAAVFRRTEIGFVSEVHEGRGAVIPLPEIQAELKLSDVYERVELATPTAGQGAG